MLLLVMVLEMLPAVAGLLFLVSFLASFLGIEVAVVVVGVLLKLGTELRLDLLASGGIEETEAINQLRVG